MSASRQYELVYIMTPDATEQEVADLHTQVEQIVERFGGTVDKTENWGRRKLAYEIGRHREGTTSSRSINGRRATLMKELDRRLRVIDVVIRHLVVRVDEEMRVAERTRDARKADRPRRRVARGLPPEPAPGEKRGDAGRDDDDRRSGWRGSDERRERAQRGGRGRGGDKDKDKDKGGARRGGGFFRRRRVCKFCAEKIDYINYKDVKLLAPFMPERGKIQPRRISGHVRDAPAQAADGHQARAAAGARAVRDGLGRRRAR